MTTVSAEEARNQFSEIVKRVAMSREYAVVTKRGKRVAAIISIEDLDLLEALLDELEDRTDVEYCRKALKNLDFNKTIPWEKVKSDLGLE